MACISAGLFAIAISLGKAQTCVLLAGGGIKCWGLNADGQLGIGNLIVQAYPAAVSLSFDPSWGSSAGDI